MTIEAGNHGTTDQVADKAHDAVDRVARTAGKAEKYARDHASRANVLTHIRDRPLMSISIAFLAGAICSSLQRLR